MFNDPKYVRHECKDYYVKVNDRWRCTFCGGTTYSDPRALIDKEDGQ